LDPPTDPNLFAVVADGLDGDFRCDVRDLGGLRRVVNEIQPDFVFHLAAQPLVLDSYRNPLDTLTTNVVGTANLLECLRDVDQPCACVVVTSDKCYANQEWEFAYRECDPLGGKDVYSASKAAAEIMTAAWERSFFQSGPVRIATARGGNVIGGGDFAPNRIVPDAMKAFSEGEALSVRSPAATRPWQHVLDCLGGYLALGQWLAGPSAVPSPHRSFNFGPDPGSLRSVRDLLGEIQKHWPGEWVDASLPDQPHEAGRLAVAIDRAAAVLGWKPSWHFSEAVENTVAWYRLFYGGAGRDELKGAMLQQMKKWGESGKVGK